MSFNVDPFTQVHDAIWAKLVASPGFTRLVRPGNRVGFRADDPVAEKRNAAEGDLPSVAVVPIGGGVDLWATSSSAVLSEGFEVRVSSGDARPSASLNKVKWQVLKAMSRGDDRLGLSFVTGVAIESVREVRVQAGWSAVLVVRVSMAILRVELGAG